MKITSKTDTGLYVPVCRHETTTTTTEPAETKINALIDFWSWVLIGAVGSLGFIGLCYLGGWFESPNEAIAKDLQKTQTQLTQTQAELAQLKACVGGK